MPQDCAPEEFPWGLEILKNPELVPAQAEFLDRVKSARPPPGVDDPLAFGVRLLTEQGDLEALAPVVVGLLVGVLARR